MCLFGHNLPKIKWNIDIMSSTNPKNLHYPQELYPQDFGRKAGIRYKTIDQMSF